MVNKIILLADDDPDDVEMFAMVLKDVDPSVKLHHVSNGSAVFEFLSQIKNQLPDVIFLDINMPEMTGWQCLRALKADSQTKNIAVIIYSTSSHPRDRQIALELDASGFITKPSDYKTLKELILAVTSNFHTDMREAINSFR